MKDFSDIRKKGFTTKNLVLCSLFAALIALGAFIKIPIGMVPVTFQVFFSVLAGLLLGPRLGAIWVLAYIFIGLVGLPVFTQGGGFWYVLQPTFGYLLGFAAGAFTSGLIASKPKKKTVVTYILAALTFILPTYLLGLPYLYCIVNLYMGKTVAAGTVIVSYCLMFLPSDAASCVLAALLAKRLKPILAKI